MFDNLSILVTGGAGFIGSHICEFLCKQNIKKLVIIDNLSTGFAENVAEIVDNNKVELIICDLCTEGECDRIFQIYNFDIVCHQAAWGSVPRSVSNPMLYHNNNVNGFMNVLEACRKYNVKKFVYASSSSVYGDITDSPKIENRIGNELSPYAVNKHITELYAKLYTSLYGVNCIGLRYFNVFGPRQNPNGEYAAVIPKFIKNSLENIPPMITGDGEQSRDFTHVDNVVEANILAMLTENNLCFGEVFNIGLGNSTSINNLWKLIAKYIKSDLKPIYICKRKGDVLNSLANINKASGLLGYKIKTDMKHGIRKTIKYYKNKKV